MRSAARLLATIKAGAGIYLEPGNPTGLTGLLTHASPRSTLLYIYSATIDKLQQLPEHSVYRQSAEAVTRQRMQTMEEIKPTGWEEWAQRAQDKVDRHPEVFQIGRSRHVYGQAGGKSFVETRASQVNDDIEWDGEKGAATLEGTRSSREGLQNARMIQQAKPDMGDPVEWEPEPPLEASQIDEAEQKIGAGLIEEVIQVAEGEQKLVDVMLESRVWEELEEKPRPGQWEYFSRDQHTPGTQEPPK